MGGGTEMALACDIVVADETASFALSEVRVGLVAAAGGLVRLPRQIPKKIAVEHILTGRADPAQQASAPRPRQPRDAGRRGAGRRAGDRRRDPGRVADLGACVDEGDDRSRRSTPPKPTAASAPPGYLDELLTSEDYLEGPKAFAEKRKPVWRNR